MNTWLHTNSYVQFRLAVGFALLIFINCNTLASQSPQCFKVEDSSDLEKILSCNNKLNWQQPFKSILPFSLEEYISLVKLYDNVGEQQLANTLLLKLSDFYKGQNQSIPHNLLFATGVHYYRNKAYKQSYLTFLDSLQIALSNEAPEQIARSKNALANLLIAFREYELAWILLEQSRQYFETIDNGRMLAIIENNLGNIKYYLKDFNHSILHYRKAISHFEKIEGLSNIAHSQMNLSRSLIKLNRYDQATFFLDKSLKFFKENEHSTRLIEIYSAKAKIAYSSNNFDQAKEFISLAENNSQQILSASTSVDFLLVQAEWLKKIDRVEEAILLMEENRQNVHNQKSTELTLQFEQLYGELLESNGNIKKSAEVWKNIALIRKPILSSEELNLIYSLATEKQSNSSNSIIVSPIVGFGSLLLGALILIGSIIVKIRKKTKLIDESESNAGSLFNFNNESKLKVDQRSEQRKIMIELMHLAIQIWEQQTGNSTIELAEQSKIWKVNIDEGRLRARAMERYLDLEKLPKNPRWKNIVKTCHFVLSQCQTHTTQRLELEQKLSKFLDMIKQQAIAA